MRLGAVVTLAVHVLDRRHRRIALTNLRLCFPERSHREHVRILRGMWRNLGWMAAECCQMRRLSPETVGRWVEIDDPERWGAVVARYGRGGVLVLTGHFGNWELFAYAQGLYGYPVHMVYRALRNPRIDEFVARVRRAAGTATVRKSVGGAGIVGAVRGGALIVIPSDQNATRRLGTFVDFFGVPASSNTGLARLALRTGLPVVPAFLVREGRRARHRIVVGPPLEIQRTGDREADIRENTRRCQRILEDMIRRHPEHWLWVHKRWRTRPPGLPRLY
jgi:KDO2-lipid IV(A) lauroyltransferase